MGDNIKVSVRLRNLIAREIQSKAEIQWVVKDKTTVCSVSSNSTSFSYDRVFADHENNEIVYCEFCAPIVESVINGFNGTIFAYGQTSSGKTYTLMGDGRFDRGIAQYTVDDIFERIQNMADREFLLRVSFMEIYNNEKVIDLLGKKSDDNLKLQDDQYGNVKVLNVTETEVQEPDQVLDLLRKGQKRRKTAETNLNQKSSRSHLILRMIIESRLRGDENAAVNVSHFNIVDLAGSEKPSENKSGERFKEGVNINTSLLMLSQVISQLSAEKESQFINYRASKLTRILKNSLGGNALTAIICTITPASYEETLSTLKFALSAKKIKNKPQVNEIETGETLIKRYANRIKKLTKQLEATKEEKDQEAKKRLDMQDQIEALKKKFVQFVPQNNIARSTRRETWGGCLDMVRMKNHFQPSRPLKLDVVDEEKEMISEGPEIDKTFSGEFFRQRLSSTVSNTISAVPNRTSSVSSVYSIDSTIDEYSKKDDVAVQTDLFQEDRSCFVSNAKIEAYEDKIAELEKELCDLKHFTTLEKQLMFDDRNSEIKAKRRSFNRSTSSPALNKSRKSDLSSLSVDEESFGVINNLVNRKSEATQNVIDLDQEMFFHNLDIIIEKLCRVLNIEALPPSIANPYFKTIYQLINIIFQKHFTGSKALIDDQVKEVLTLLTRIFVGFSDHDDCLVQNSDLLIHFDKKAEKLLTDFEKILANCVDSSKATDCVETENLIDTITDAINISSEIPNTSILTEPLNGKEYDVNSITLSSCQCKHEISSLEETISTHLETINRLQIDNELIKKQLTLSEDKVKIQEQVIASLEKETELKVKCCAELTDNFTQTSYMSYPDGAESIIRKSLHKEVPSSKDWASKSSCPNCLKSQNSSVEQRVSDPSLSMIKSELCDIRLLTQRMMEDSMPKCLTDDVTSNESLDPTSVDFLIAEIKILKSMLHKIKFYLKDRSDWSKHLESQMVDKMAEISSLHLQCSSTEKELHEKENHLNKLSADLSAFRKETSERRLSISTLSTELKCLHHDETWLVDDIAYLKKVMKSFADAVVDRHSALEELRQKHAMKEDKSTETVENYPDLAALEEVRAHEFKERAHLCQRNTSLELKVEELIRKIKDLEQDLKSKEDKISEMQKIFEEEIEETLSHHKELEKNWKETMQKHVKDIEDKYEEELKNQEKSLFDMMEKRLKSLRDEHKLQRERKQQECKLLEEHYEKVISQLKVRCEALKSEFQSKLVEEMDNRTKSELKLESEIRDCRKREEATRNACYKLTSKCKEYVRAMRMEKAKCVKEKETQTHTENSPSEISNECKTLKQEQEELKTQSSLKNSELASLETKNRNMMKEIADLKKDLNAKTGLLLTCNCRLFARPQDLVRAVPHKTKNSDAAEADWDQDQLRKNAAENPKEILKLDFVQRAIVEAREAERAIFNNGEGPLSQEMCFLLQRKLAKKDKEISELKNIISQKHLKAAPVKNRPENCENRPPHPIDAEVLDSFTPCVKTGNKYDNEAVLKVPPKKILNEVNDPHNVDVPRNKWFMTEEEAEKAKELEENLQKYGKETACKQQ